MRNKDLVKLIESECEWPDLINKLKQEDFNFGRNRKHSVTKVLKLWYYATESKVFEDEWNEKLPGSITEKDGKTYILHGIIHDGLKKRHRVSEEYKQFIRENINGWEVICEQGFKESFSLPNKISYNDCIEEMKDLNYAIAQILPNPEKMVGGLLKLLAKGLLLAPFMIPYQTIKKNFGFSGENYKESIRRINNLKSLEDLGNFRQYLNRFFLPAPLSINMHHFIYEGTSNSQSRYEWDNMSLRSAFQAKEMAEFAEKKDINELHALVGFAHESQIKYFLQHPEVIERMKDDERYITGKKYIEARISPWA